MVSSFSSLWSFNNVSVKCEKVAICCIKIFHLSTRWNGTKWFDQRFLSGSKNSNSKYLRSLLIIVLRSTRTKLPALRIAFLTTTNETLKFKKKCHWTKRYWKATPPQESRRRMDSCWWVCGWNAFPAMLLVRTIRSRQGVFSWARRIEF